MKCLIIASGQGKRLAIKNELKPLVPLMGLPLIAQVILRARKAGLDDFYVVTGYNGERLREYLHVFGKRRKIKITCLQNDNWKEENGLSVLRAKNVINENFILLMCDHILSEEIIRKLKKNETDDQVILAVDSKIEGNHFVDHNDVTKVCTKDGKVVDIGKNISEYNAFDTGVFLCSPAIFKAVEKSIENGDTSLTGGIKLLASKGKVRTCDVDGHYWIDIDNEKSLKQAEKLLCQELTKPSDGIISRYINRKISVNIFTPFLIKIYKGFTPNQVSIISFVVSFISGLCFLLNRAIIGALLIQMASILDGCDGEIARLKHLESTLGNFIDAILDRYADGFILLGVFYYSLGAIGNREIVGFYWSPLIICSIAVLAILGNLMVSYSSAKSIVNFGYRYKGRWIAAGRGRDIRLFILFIGGIMTYFHPFFAFLALCILAIQTNIIVLWRILLSRNHFLNRDFLLKNKTKAVIFDFDGTIADTMTFLTELAVKLITKNYNIPKQEAKIRYLESTGLNFANQIELIFPNHPNNQRVSDIFESKKSENIFNYDIFPEVNSVFEYFADNKIKTFICSSTKQEIITRYLNLNNIGNLIDGAFGYKIGFGKSQQIDFILHSYRIQPNEIIFVGDSLRDCDIAKDRDINFIGISRIFSEADFQKKNVLSVNSLTAFAKLFESSEDV